MLAELDLLIRGAAVGISILTFTLLWWNPDARRKSYSVGAIAITLAGHLAETQGISGVWSETARNMALVVGHFMPVALTWFVLDIFLENPERRSPLANALMGFSVIVWSICLLPSAFAPLGVVSSVALELGLLYLVLTTGRGDLVERRRSFRTVFVGALLAFGISKILFDAAVSDAAKPVWADTVYASAVLVFVIVFAHWALRPGRDIWVEPSATAKPKPADPADTHTLALIDAAMRDELWRQEGLTIGAMAEALDIPEHRLRKAINRDLGYRNFPAFVNGYRIEAAKSALAAPEESQTTILEIAYDCGFASLGPFNKTFKALTGVSPSAFRRQAIGHMLVDS